MRLKLSLIVFYTSFLLSHYTYADPPPPPPGCSNVELHQTGPYVVRILYLACGSKPSNDTNNHTTALEWERRYAVVQNYKPGVYPALEVQKWFDSWGPMDPDHPSNTKYKYHVTQNMKIVCEGSYWKASCTAIPQ